MKRVLIIVVIVATGMMSKAQTISFGPTGGFGHAWITNSTGDTKFNPAWNAGLSFIYSSRSHFGLGIDAKYSAEGDKIEYTAPEGNGMVNYKNTVDANYIRVPVKFIYFGGNNKSAVRPKIYAGPSMGFLVGGKTVTRVEGTGLIDKVDTKDQMKSFDFGVTAGAGLNFRVAPRTWLNTDLAFYQGLIDVTKASNVTKHNGDVGLNVGLLVGLGR